MFQHDPSESSLEYTRHGSSDGCSRMWRRVTDKQTAVQVRHHKSNKLLVPFTAKEAQGQADHVIGICGFCNCYWITMKPLVPSSHSLWP